MNESEISINRSDATRIFKYLFKRFFKHSIKIFFFQILHSFLRTKNNSHRNKLIQSLHLENFPLSSRTKNKKIFALLSICFIKIFDSNNHFQHLNLIRITYLKKSINSISANRLRINQNRYKSWVYINLLIFVNYTPLQMVILIEKIKVISFKLIKT